jgi:hypothetical protein
MDQNKEMAMFSLYVRRILSVTIAVAAIGCVAAPRRLAAASPDKKGATITFSASGTFTTTQVSGADTLKLSGQPFTIIVVGNTSMKPIKHGQNWANFKPLSVTGTVYSGLIPDQPIAISSTTAAIDQTVGASEDILQAGFPVTVIGIPLTVRAHIILPGGTLTNALLRPFASVALDSTNATVTYSNTTASTVLGVQSGTVAATLPAKGGNQRAAAAAPSAFVLLANAPAVKPRMLPAFGQ